MIRNASGWAALRSRDFRLFISARFLSGLAMQIQNVGLGWLVYDRTGSALALGLVGLAAFLPALALALVTGHVADRFDRRRIMSLCWSVVALASLGLLLVALNPKAPVWPIYALAVVVGSARAFANPASQALLPNLVGRDGFASAVALNASAWQTSSIAGPAVGGILYAFGPPVVFAAALASFATSALLIAFIRSGERAPVREKTTLATLLAGIVFIRERPVILGAISLDLFAVLLGGATALLPIYARDVLFVGPVGLGMLRSAPAIGAVAMSITLASRPLQHRAGRTMFFAVGLFGVATIIFGLSTNLILSLACLVALGAADMVSVYVRQTLVQSETPDAMRGRVAAVNSVFIGASNELGEFESGVVAAAIGAVPAVVVGGVGTVVVAVLWARLFPGLWKRDRLVAEPR
ncbi:MFS transporter [Alsobacter metallidurans]|uniref:MFS transporter n=1 Tax=Alsobacter metallidurans TaxID=340221 RepID=A0A917ID65_9HYPH|nr:MFS transporter [Alsobacter metallidurans]GGH33810.1 MFS transporter [Alsobacter metallidurans]